MQIDWANHGLMRIGECTLCYSRLLYVEFFLSHSMECLLAANRHALEYYGASTRRAMHDNLKTAMLERLPDHAPVFNPRYLDLPLNTASSQWAVISGVASVSKFARSSWNAMG